MKLGVLIVTYNRLEYLKKLIEIYIGDSNINYLVIVDNNSNDGTSEYLRSLNPLTAHYKYFHLPRNIGGSGGFYYGLNYMKDLDIDWIYLSDDDAYPQGSMFSNFKNRAQFINSSNISAVCTSVVNNGKYDLNHRRYIKKGLLSIKEIPTSIQDYKKKEFEIDIYSFVGIFLNKKKLSADNLPEKEYFIWYDDSEHAHQMRKYGKIICWPELVVNHDVVNSKVEINWKLFYGIRNRLHAYKKHFGFRYFLFLILKFTFRVIKKNNRTITKLYFSSFYGALMNKLGIHDIYKPGWKP